MRGISLKTLGIAIGVIVIFTAIIGIGLVIPNKLTKPAYDFLYYSSSDQSAQNAYTVDNGVLRKNSVQSPLNAPGARPRGVAWLYRYDVSKNTSLLVDLAEATRLQLITGSISPDGFKLVYEKRDKPVGPLALLNEISEKNTYLKKNTIYKAVNLQQLTDSFFDVHFLAWVKP